MSFKQAAFEIRFSTTDSGLEVYDIRPDHKSKENVPEPFKKRDKIPRSSGSIDFTNGSNINSNSNSNNNSNSSNNHSISNTAAPRHSSTDSQAPIRSRHHPNGDNLNGRMSSNSDQVSPLKVKSSNSVGPEADKQLQRLSGGKNLNVERSNSLGNNNNDVNASEDDSIIRNPHSSNKKQRSLKVDEISGEKEKGNLSKIIPNHNLIMDSNGKSEMVSPNNKIMHKTIIKNKKLSTLSNNNNNKDDENIPIPKDGGIATPPDTPPRSPARSPQTPSTVRQKRSDNDITDQLSLEQIQLATPPLSSSSTISNDDVSTQSSRIIQSPRASKKRRGSHSSQFSSEMPAAKLQVPRSRRLSSVTSSKPIVTAEQSQEPFTSQLSNKSKEVKEVQNSQQSQQSQQSQPTVPPKSRIPRLSMSSRERPVIAKKESHGSISLSSQGSNKFNESKESLSSSPVTSSKRGLRSAISRPIINTSFITDVEVESESPTSYSPTNSPISYSSPTSRSPTSQSPTSQSPPSISSTNHSIPQKKLTISHDDVIVPTVAKKLKMNGQLHFVNHDALLGYSEEPENISPSSENGYMDITDQVVDLFDSPRNKPHKKKSLPDSQRRPKQSSRKSSHSRNSSKAHYVAPRKQNHQPAQQTEDSSSPMITEPVKRSNPSTFNDDKRRKSRREEYIMVIRDDDDIEFIEPVPSIPSEPIIKAPDVQVKNDDDQIYQEKIVEPEPVQAPVVQYDQYNNNGQYDQYNNDQYNQYNNNQYDQYNNNQYNQYDQYKEFNANPTESTETTTDPIVTSGKTKKDKKKKQKKGDLDEDEVVKRSTCRCTIM